MFHFKEYYNPNDHDSVVAICDEGIVTFNKYTNDTTIRPFAKLRSITIRDETRLDRLWGLIGSLVAGAALAAFFFFWLNEGYLYFFVPIICMITVIAGFAWFFAPLEILFVAVTRYGKLYSSRINPRDWKNKFRNSVEKWLTKAENESGDELTCTLRVQ